MTRVLLTCVPAISHVLALAVVAADLAARGHAVAWAVDPALAPFTGDAPRWPTATAGGDPRDGGPARWSGTLQQLFTRTLPPLTAAMLPGIEAAIAAFRPDVVVVDQLTLAGAIAARRHGLPWVAVHTVPAALGVGFEGLPGVQRWVDEAFAAPQRAAGVTPLPWPLRSPHGTLIAATPSLLPPGAPIDADDALIGPLTPHRAPDLAPGDDGPAVVSLGTLFADAHRPLLRRLVDALAARGPVVVTWPPPIPALPPGVDAAPWHDLPAALARARRVVGHAGYNTTAEALWYGKPLLLAPLAFDQHPVAARVEALGAGLRLPADADAARVDAALDRLTDPAFAAAARAAQAELRAAPGPAGAADRVLAAASGRSP